MNEVISLALSNDREFVIHTVFQAFGPFDYFVPGLSVCLFFSFRAHISGITCPIFINFCKCYPWPWLGLPLPALRYVTYTSGFMDDVIFAYNWATCRGAGNVAACAARPG